MLCKKILEQTTNFAGKYHFLCIRKELSLGFKAGIQLQNKNHTEDWTIGCHPYDNSHVTH